MKQLKSELTALDRKITAELAPKKEELVGEEIEPTDTLMQQQANITPKSSKQQEDKSSMVAEPKIIYNNSQWNKKIRI